MTKRIAAPITVALLGLTASFWSCWEKYGYPSFDLTDRLEVIYYLGIMVMVGGVVWLLRRTGP